MACVVALASWKAIGYLPVVIDERGEVVQRILLWLADLQSQEGPAFATLRRNANGLARFHDFWTHHHQEFKGAQEAAFLAGFWKAVREGDAALGWKATRPNTARQYMLTLNQFTCWLVEKAGRGREHPYGNEEIPWCALLARQARNIKTQFPRLSLPSEGRSKNSRRRPGGGAGSAKAFSLEDFNQLIIHEKQPRLLLLWLLLGAGGARVSEVMHLYPGDFGFDAATQEARVTLADPQTGEVKSEDSGGSGTLARQEFLRIKHGRKPRNLLPDTDILRAGWKRPKKKDFPAHPFELTWIHSIYGQMTWAAHTIYLKQRALAAPSHPWHLVNLARNVGEPLTTSNVQSLFARACQRLNLDSPRNPDALRQMHAEVIARGSVIRIENLLAGLRRSPLLHTMVYDDGTRNSPNLANGRRKSKAARRLEMHR